MNICFEYSVENCLQSIFTIYELKNYVKRGVNKIPINKVVNECEIKNLVNMYRRNTHVFDLLSQYCIVPDNIYKLGYPERCHNYCFTLNCSRLHYFLLRSSFIYKYFEVFFNLKKNWGRLQFEIFEVVFHIF